MLGGCGAGAGVGAEATAGAGGGCITCARGRVAQVDLRAELVLRISQLSGVDRVDDGARVLERAALAVLRSAQPAGVEQPRIRTLALQAVSKHLRVLEWVPHEEGLAVARREGGDGGRDALLGARHLGGVAVEEVVDDLLFRKTRNGRQHAEAIAREQNDILRLIPQRRELGIGNRLWGTGGPTQCVRRRIEMGRGALSWGGTGVVWSVEGARGPSCACRG